jgi:hypothetical protein
MRGLAERARTSAACASDSVRFRTFAVGAAAGAETAGVRKRVCGDAGGGFEGAFGRFVFENSVGHCQSLGAASRPAAGRVQMRCRGRIAATAPFGSKTSGQEVGRGPGPALPDGVRTGPPAEECGLDHSLWEATVPRQCATAQEPEAVYVPLTRAFPPPRPVRSGRIKWRNK